MTDNSAQNNSNPTAKEVAKNIGNLSKEIIKALNAMSGIELNPKTGPNTDKAETNMKVFNTILSGSIKNIVTNLNSSLGGISGDIKTNADLIKQAVGSLKKMASGDAIEQEKINSLSNLGALCDENGALRGFLDYINDANFDAESIKKKAAGVAAVKGLVAKIGLVITEANSIPKLDKDVNSVTSMMTDVNSKLTDIQSSLNVFDDGVLAYFTGDKKAKLDNDGNVVQKKGKDVMESLPSKAMERANMIKVAISGSKAALSKVITEYVGMGTFKVKGKDVQLKTIQSWVNGIHSNITSMLVNDKGIIGTIFSDIEATRDFMMGLDEEVFRYFMETTTEVKEGTEGAIKKTIPLVTLNESSTETLGTIDQWYIKNASEFAQLVNNMKLSLTAIKKVAGPIDVYSTIFDNKKEKSLITARQIEKWAGQTTRIHDKMQLVVGAEEAILTKIAHDIRRFGNFSFTIPANLLGKPNDSKFGQLMKSMQGALKSAATAKNTIISYVGMFATKGVAGEYEYDKDGHIVNTIKAAEAAKTTDEVIYEWEKGVARVSLSLNKLFDEKGIIGEIINTLKNADKASLRWKIGIPRTFTEEITVKEKKVSIFQNRIDNIKSAIAALKKLGDIPKAVSGVQQKLDADFGSVTADINAIRKRILQNDDKRNPIAKVIALVCDIDAMINRMVEDEKIKELTDTKKWINPKTNEVDPIKGNAWGKQLNMVLTTLKSIQVLAQIPKEVQKTKDKLDKMESGNIKDLVEEIKTRASDLLEQVGDGLIGIDEVVRNSNLAKITKETSDSITNTNAALRGIQDIVQTIVDSGEMMEKISYRRLIHASIQIEFFIEMITSILKDLDGVSQQFTAQQSNIEETSKRILKALEPIKRTFVNLNEIVEVITNANNISPRKLKARANRLRKRIVASVAMLNDLIPVIAKDIEAMTPDDKQLAKDFRHILEPIKNLIDLMKTIMEVKIPNKFVLKYKIWILKSRIVYIAQAMDELNTEISKIRGNKIDNSALRSVQASMMAITSIIESFNNAAKICAVLLIRGKFVRPAIKLIIKQLDIFDKLTERINRMKDTHKANRKIRRMEELVRGVAFLAISMILLVPILALFIIASPLLVIGIVVFALTMKLIIKLIDFMINAKVGLAIVELALVVMALIAIALLFIVLAMLAEPLLKGLPMICLMMLGILAFAAVLAVFGLLVSVMWPFMLAGLAGIGIVTIAVVCILVIALVLKALEFINLNPTAVLDNVHVVLDTAKEVMMLAFGPETDPRGPNQETGFLDVIGGALVNIIRVLAASVILILTVVSVAAILIIATLLRMLALYDVEKLKQGKANAAVTLGVAREVVDLLFGSDAPKSEESKDRGTFEALIDYVAKPLSALLKAIFAVAYLAVMVIAISMIMLLATQIRLLALFNPQELENGKTNALLTVQTAASIIAELFRADDTDRTPSERGGLLCVVGYLFGKEFEDIIRAVLSVAYLGVLLLSTFLVLLLARQISEIGKLSPGTISQGKANALLVVKTAGEIMGSIFGAGDTDTGEEGGSWLKKILKWVLPSDLYFMIDAMIKIGKLALLVMAVGAIGKLAEQLTALSKFNVNSTTAKNKAMMVINSAGSLVTNLKSMSNDADVSEKDASKMYELCTSLEKIPGALVPVANNIMKLASINEESINSATANGLTVIRATRQMIEELNGFDYNDSGTRARLDIMDRISQTVGSFVKVTDSDVENSKNITENYIKFFKQIDSMDVKKLQHTDYLMRSWASISRDLKGNFEGLAQTINQHIMPMLEKVNETLQKTTQCQQEIIAELTKPVDINGGGGSTSLGTPPSDTPSGQTTLENPSSTGRDGSYADTVNPAHREAGKQEHGKGKTPPPNMKHNSTIEPKKDKKYVVTFATIKEA